MRSLRALFEGTIYDDDVIDICLIIPAEIKARLCTVADEHDITLKEVVFNALLHYIEADFAGEFDRIKVREALNEEYTDRIPDECYLIRSKKKICQPTEETIKEKESCSNQIEI